MNNLFDPGFYDETELKKAGFKSLGNNIKIAKNCTIISPENIEIGDNVRIDGYCTITASGEGWLTIGSHVHIGGYSTIIAGGGILMNDFSGISQGVRIYSTTDDYSGKKLTNPTVKEKYTGVVKGTVTLGRHVIIGSGTVILPKVSIGDGSSVGALSLVNKSLDSWGIYFGIPAKRLKSRSKYLLELEAQLEYDEISRNNQTLKNNKQ